LPDTIDASMPGRLGAKAEVVGKRADLIRVRVAGDVPAVRSVWRGGRRVA
jgi:alpha-D-ribose 1-methylphosphonate 5-triphosphate diphosphatase PhnM